MALDDFDLAAMLRRMGIFDPEAPQGGPSAFPGGDVQLPAVNMQRDLPVGPPREDVIADRFPQEALLQTLGRAEFGANPEGAEPRFEAGGSYNDDVYFSGKGQMMTPQQTTDYIDFISPRQQSDEDDDPETLKRKAALASIGGI